MRSPIVILALLALLTSGCLGGNNAGTGGGGGGVQSPLVAQSCVPTPASPDASWKPEWPQVEFTTTKGVFTARLELEKAPLTAGNFLDLTRKAYYDGVTFHRVAKNFVIQGGDPTGTGGGGAASSSATLPDEFNPSLRHDTPGILSMATAGPDTGGSQFFVTLTPATNLDDRHSVFGRVESGMDVVNAIGALAPSSGDGAPTEKVTMTKVAVIEPKPFDAKHAVGVHAVIAEKKAEATRAVTYAVVLKNEGTVRDSIGLKATVPAGWTCKVNDRPIVPAGTARVVFLTLTPPAGATGSTEIPLSAVSAWNGTSEAAGSVRVTIAPLGAAIKEGDKVTANYAGFLPDGRLFDTSIEAVGKDAAMPKFNTTGGWQGRPSYSTFPFTVGSGVIAGFTNLAKTAKVGETVTALIPAKDAYATGNMYQRPLTARALVFELEIVSVG